MNSDEIFFEEEILVHYEYLEKYLKVFLCDDILAEDILQETMTRAWEKIFLLKSYHNIRGALRTISSNIFINYGKTKMNQELCLDDLMQKKLCTEKDNLLIILDEENKRTLLDAIGKLKEPCVNIIILKYYYELPFTEIASLLEINYNTVLSHHRRSMVRLKKLLSP